MSPNILIRSINLTSAKEIFCFFPQFHKLTERQFTWVSLLARAKRYQWRDCEELVITKSWLAPLGGKNKASVNPERVVQILYDNGAPGEALQGK